MKQHITHNTLYRFLILQSIFILLCNASLFAQYTGGQGKGDDSFLVTYNFDPITDIVLLSPSNNGANVSVVPRFLWEHQESVDVYHLQISEGADFSTLLVDRDNLTDTTFFSQSILAKQTTYFWRVKGRNEGLESGWSSTFTFNTGNPRYVGNGNDGFGGTIGRSQMDWMLAGSTITAKLSRSVGTFTDMLILYFDTGIEGRNVIDNQVYDTFDTHRAGISLLDGTGITFAPDFNASYALAINSNFAGIWRIPSSGVVDNNGLEFVSSAQSTLQDSSQIEFQFEFDLGQLHIAGDSVKWVSVYLNPNSSFISDENFGEFEILNGNLGNGSHSLNGFHTYEIDRPRLIAPHNEASSHTILPEFSWEMANPTAGYEFQLSLFQDFRKLVDSLDNYVQTTYTRTSFLDNDSTYYWRVKNIDEQGQKGIWSETFTFTTSKVLPWYSQNAVTYYPFNGTATDESFYSNHGTLVNSSFTSDVGEVENAALWIERKNAGLQIPVITTENSSVSFWYYMDATENNWNTLLAGSDNNFRHLLIEPDTYDLGIFDNGFFSSGTNLLQNRWYHIVLVRQGNQASVYLNKDLVLSRGVSYTNDAHPITIIGNNADLTQGALGTLDEVRIFDFALSPAQIEQIYELDALPLAPTSLSSAMKYYGLELGWTVSIEDKVTSFIIYRGTQLDNLNAIATLPKTDTTKYRFTDVGIAPNGKYLYSISAVDSLGRKSLREEALLNVATISPTIRAVFTPKPLQNDTLLVEVTIGDSVKVQHLHSIRWLLQWNSDSLKYVGGSAKTGAFFGDGAPAFFQKIEGENSIDMAVASANGQEVDSAGTLASLKFVALGVDTLQISFSGIAGQDKNGRRHIIASDSAELIILPEIPTPPSQITPVVQHNQIALSWLPSSNMYVTDYKISKSVDNIEWDSLTTVSSNILQFTDSELLPGTYYYHINSLFKSDLIGPPSDTVKATVRGTLAYFSFDNSTTDSTGRFNGQFYGEESYNDGWQGKAIGFNGTDNWLKIPHHNTFVFDTLATVKLWVKVNDTARKQMILNGDGITPFVLEAVDSKYRLTVSAGGSSVSVASELEVSGLWQLLVWRYNGAVVEFFVNDKLQQSVSLQNNLSQITDSLTVGKVPANTDYLPFSGQIQELAFYNRLVSRNSMQHWYSQFLDAEIGSSLTAWYPLNDTTLVVVDSSGNGRNGAFLGTSPIKNRFMKDNSARNFDGVADYVTLPGNFTIGEGLFSVNLWVKSNFYNADFEGIFQLSDALKLEGLILQASGRDSLLSFGMGTVGSNINLISYPMSDISDDEWHMITGVRESQTRLSLFIDGQKVSSFVFENLLSVNLGENGVSRLGTFEDFYGTLYPFKGAIDDVRIWNKAISADEIQQLYTANDWARLEFHQTFPGFTISGMPLDIAGAGFGGLTGMVLVNNTVVDSVLWSDSLLTVVMPESLPVGQVDVTVQHARTNTISFPLEIVAPIEVWPGDTNNDKRVNGADLLPIGRFFEAEDYAFPEGMQWTGYNRLPWSLDEDIPSRVFADANGDGIINYDDVLAIYAYYDNHVGVSNNVLLKDEVSSDTLVIVAHKTSNVGSKSILHLSTFADIAYDIRGISFSFSADWDEGNQAVRPKATFGFLHPLFTKSMSFTRFSVPKNSMAVVFGSTNSTDKLSGLLTEIHLEGVTSDQEGIEISFEKISAINNSGKSLPVIIVWKNETHTTREIEEAPPTTFELRQNYPNPFNPTTSIQFALPEPSRVRLQIYDIQGRLLRTVIESNYLAGVHTVAFNATGLSSGMYFYQVQMQPNSGNRAFIQTKKMIVLK